MKTSATNEFPEISWDFHELIENHGHTKTFSATGESADGRKWSGTGETCNDEEVDVYDIEPEELDEPSDPTNLWWGYRHVNGTLQAKRYFDSRDISEAMESDFVDVVVRPFPAKDRECALLKVSELSMPKAK